jgi:predicted TIM-barrel fold metal-dependent hydrolase
MTSTGEIPGCAAADPNPKKPHFVLPAGACDCHAHILWPQDVYPYTPNRTYTPPEASLSSYTEMLNTLGLDRAVIVHPSVYGTDNRATLDAIKIGGPNFRGVVVVDANIELSELESMHQLGIRGVRINLLFKGGIGISEVRRLAEKIAPLGWHLQMLIDVSEFSELDTLADLPVDVVFDHMGHMPTTKGVDHPGFIKMLKMVERGNAWVKLSGAYRLTSSKELPYADTMPYAHEIIKTNPERVVWATDWPHPFINVPMPNDGDLLDLLVEWAPDSETRNRILVDNPAKLYDFGA